jgi:TolB protein
VGSELRRIYTVYPDGSNLKLVTSQYYKGGLHPAWSSDGKKIAFSALKDGGTNIYVIDVATKVITNLTNNTFYNDYPAWSPDGKKILFASDQSSHDLSKLDIFIMNADGSSQQPLLTWDSDERHPAWSPDGKKIVFISDASGVGNAASREIYIMNKDGSGAKRLTNNGYEDNHPRFVTPRKP